MASRTARAAAGIVEVDTFEARPLAAARHGGGPRRIDDRRAELHELEEVPQEQAVLVEPGEAAERAVERAEPALEGLEVHDHIADREAPRTARSAMKTKVANTSTTRWPVRRSRPGATACDAQPLVPDQSAQGLEALAEDGAEVKQAQLLGVAGAGQDGVVVPRAAFALGAAALPGERRASSSAGGRGGQGGAAIRSTTATAGWSVASRAAIAASESPLWASRPRPLTIRIGRKGASCWARWKAS